MLHNRRIGKHFEDGQRLEKKPLPSLFRRTSLEGQHIGRIVRNHKIPFAPIKAYVEQGDSSKTPSEPPFWAVRMYPWIHYTLGGLSINTDANCLTTSGQPIPQFICRRSDNRERSRRK